MTELTDNLQIMKISWISEIMFSQAFQERWFIPCDGSGKKKKKPRQKVQDMIHLLDQVTKINLLEYELKYKIIKY